MDTGIKLSFQKGRRVREKALKREDPRGSSAIFIILLQIDTRTVYDELSITKDFRLRPGLQNALL